MTRNLETRKPGNRCQRGSAAMMAILALSALLIGVLAMLMLANNVLISVIHQKRLISLRALAESGLQYGYWQVVWNHVTPPITYANLPLGHGSFTVTLTDNRPPPPHPV